ncbi:MAG: carboxypeptidase-like regulatory domain-containing protein [Ferruginibacter sp.]
MQKLQLTIPEPCHENWQQMTATDKGRFCNACAKEVVDFSTMTDMQVLNYFSALTHEKVCGRALPEQLNRTISRPIVAKRKLFWYWNYIVMVFIFFTKGNTARAQGGIKPITECSPVKANDTKGEIAAVNVGRKTKSLVISGNVTDTNGNPVSFASIKIKNKHTSVYADANGAYSFRVKPADILVISGLSFKTAEVPVKNQSVLNAVLEFDDNQHLKEVIVTMWGAIRREYYSETDKKEKVATLKVKDEETGKYLPDVSIVINENGSSDTVLTNRSGIYKIKGITEYARYFIKVTADGYEGTEFTINETDFNDRKKEWEVLLRKQKVEDSRSKVTAKPATEIIRMAGMSAISADKKPLYVVDGIIMSNYVDIDPDDVEDYSVLQGPAATALFGTVGENGAIVITTRKSKVRDLDTFFISASSLNVGVIKVVSTTSSVMGGMVKGITIKRTNTISDSLNMIATKINGAIKIYPNPVHRGTAFNVALKLKQTGQYQIQITDVTGRVVLQKQINAVAKELTENIASDSRWSSGVYYISLIDNKNKLISKTSFIFQ